MHLKKSVPEKRSQERNPIEPTDTGHFLEAIIENRKYRFKVLNICRGGIGMLVTSSQAEVLKILKKGCVMEMDYINPKGCLGIKVEIRHISMFKEGLYKGDYSVGFSMSI